MYLRIGNPDNLDLEEFAYWLKDQILDFINDESIKDIELENLWSKFFEENDLGWARDEFGNPTPPTINHLLNIYFNNLIIKKQENDYLITNDSNIKLRNTNLTIDALTALMNYGTLAVPPYPYIDDVFQAFENNLQTYYNIWLEITGRSLLNYEESGGEV